MDVAAIFMGGRRAYARPKESAAPKDSQGRQEKETPGGGSSSRASAAASAAGGVARPASASALAAHAVTGGGRGGGGTWGRGTPRTTARADDDQGSEENEEEEEVYGRRPKRQRGDSAASVVSGRRGVEKRRKAPFKGGPKASMRASQLRGPSRAAAADLGDSASASDSDDEVGYDVKAERLEYDLYFILSIKTVGQGFESR